MLKAVFLDLGNTLVDYHAGTSTDDEKDLRGLRAMSERLASWGVPVPTDVLYQRFYKPWTDLFPSRKSSPKEFDLERLLNVAIPTEGLTPERVKTLLLDFYRPSVEDAVTDPGTREALQELRSCGVQAALISNSAIPGYCHDLTLERLDLLNALDFRLYSYDEGIRKPSHEIFRRAMARAGAASEECVMIGDSRELDLLPAAALGMRIVQYHSERKAPLAGPDMNGPGFLGLAGTIPQAIRLVLTSESASPR